MGKCGADRAKKGKKDAQKKVGQTKMEKMGGETERVF